MKTTEELKLDALKREYRRLSNIAERKKKLADEMMSVGTEKLAIHNEFVELVQGGVTPATERKLAELQKRNDRADKLLKMDSVKVMDEQIEAEFERDQLKSAIQSMEYYMQRGK